MKKCVVSFADSGHNGLYQRNLKRLEQSLKGNFDGDFLGFTDYKEIGCEPHSVIPYKFKPYAIQKAIDLGYELVLWCDSPIIAVKPLSAVFEHIEKHGYLFFDNIGHPLGKWSNDKALKFFNLTREQAMEIKMIMACCMGFNFSGGFDVEFELYRELADELYSGSWEDHRHDQTVMSAIIHENHLDINIAHETFFMYEFFKDVKEFKIADSVCLVSR